MSGFATGTPEMFQAARNMETTNGELMGHLNGLAQAVEAAQPEWQGKAGNAFTTLMGQFAADAKVLNENLVQIAEAVSGSATAFDAQEDQSASEVSAIIATLENG